MRHDFVLTGIMPILFHADDVLASDMLSEWRKNPKNKAVSTPGDDRSPAWTWQLYLYSDGENVAMPQEAIMACLRKAGAQIPKQKGKGTFMRESQSGLLIDREYFDFTSGGKSISMESIGNLKDMTFKEQFDAVKDLGFELKVKRAKVGSSKHVRVRAMWKRWEVRGSVMVTNPIITTQTLTEMFQIAGQSVGLLDWRPSAPQSPGPYGTFTATVKAIK